MGMMLARSMTLFTAVGPRGRRGRSGGGQFRAANKEQASAENERNTITVEGALDGHPTKVVFTQIAGLIARRIICYKKPGDLLAAGERVGLIKFGSRVDVFLGPEWQVTVQPGERVQAGSSVIARAKETV